MSSLFLHLWDALALLQGDGDDPDNLPPGSPPTCMTELTNLCVCIDVHSVADKFEGPWFTTQIVISGTIGLLSFLVFSYCRTRWPLLFAPRTKLKGMSCDLHSFCKSSCLYRFFATRGACSSSILWLDSAHY